MVITFVTIVFVVIIIIMITLMAITSPNRPFMLFLGVQRIRNFIGVLSSKLKPKLI